MSIKIDWQAEKKSLRELHNKLTGSPNELPHGIWPFSFTYEHLLNNPRMKLFLDKFNDACEIKEKTEDQLLLELWNFLPNDSPLKELGAEKFYSFWSRLNRDPLQLAVVDPEMKIIHSMILADHFSGDGFNPKSERFHIYKDHVNWIMSAPDQKYIERWSKDFIKCKNNAKKPDQSLLKIISTFQSLSISWDGFTLDDCPDSKNIMKEILHNQSDDFQKSMDFNSRIDWDKNLIIASKFVPIIC